MTHRPQQPRSDRPPYTVDALPRLHEASRLDPRTWERRWSAAVLATLADAERATPSTRSSIDPVPPSVVERTDWGRIRYWLVWEPGEGGEPGEWQAVAVGYFTSSPRATALATPDPLPWLTTHDLVGARRYLALGVYLLLSAVAAAGVVAAEAQGLSPWSLLLLLPVLVLTAWEAARLALVHQLDDHTTYLLQEAYPERDSPVREQLVARIHELLSTVSPTTSEDEATDVVTELEALARIRVSATELVRDNPHRDQAVAALTTALEGLHDGDASAAEAVADVLDEAVLQTRRTVEAERARDRYARRPAIEEAGHQRARAEARREERNQEIVAGLRAYADERDRDARAIEGGLRDLEDHELPAPDPGRQERH